MRVSSLSTGFKMQDSLCLAGLLIFAISSWSTVFRLHPYHCALDSVFKGSSASGFHCFFFGYLSMMSSMQTCSLFPGLRKEISYLSYLLLSE